MLQDPFNILFLLLVCNMYQFRVRIFRKVRLEFRRIIIFVIFKSETDTLQFFKSFSRIKRPHRLCCIPQCVRQCQLHYFHFLLIRFLHQFSMREEEFSKNTLTCVKFSVFLENYLNEFPSHQNIEDDSEIEEYSCACVLLE